MREILRARTACIQHSVVRRTLSSQSMKFCHSLPVGEMSRLDLFRHYRLAAYAGGFRMHDGA